MANLQRAVWTRALDRSTPGKKLCTKTPGPSDRTVINLDDDTEVETDTGVPPKLPGSRVVESEHFAGPSPGAGGQEPELLKRERPRKRARVDDSDTGIARDGPETRSRTKKVAPKKSVRTAWSQAHHAPGCTCGFLIHSERCQLFRGHRGYTIDPKRVDTPPPKMRSAPPETPKPSLSPVSLVSKSSNVSDWVQGEIARVAREVAALPHTKWRNAWKQKMAQYHPDKHPAGGAPVLEKPRTEVFIELRRLYEVFGFVSCANT